MNILIVEDDESIANLIKINLSAEGYQCTCAYDGKVGADYIERCFLQALFGESCKTFLEKVASPNWRKLQSLGWLYANQPKAIADSM